MNNFKDSREGRKVARRKMKKYIYTINRFLNLGDIRGE